MSLIGVALRVIIFLAVSLFGVKNVVNLIINAIIGLVILFILNFST